MTAPSWLDARRILVVRLDNIGDVIMLGPALRAIKEQLPQTHITLLGSRAGITAAPVLPWIDDTITWRPIWQEIDTAFPHDPERDLELVGRVRAGEFDAALIFTSFSQTPHVPGYLCYLAGIPLRAGDSKEFGGRVLTLDVRDTPDELHQVERNLRLIEAAGFAVRDRSLGIRIPTAACENADALLMATGIRLDRPFILLHPGASAPARRYPAERFGVAARLLTERGHQVLVTGVERESALVQAVQEAAPQVHMLMSATSLAEYAALVARAGLVICNNTLPLHLADATGVPVVCLYSGSDLESHWRPRDVPNALLRRPTPCYPCRYITCPIGLPCLDISPQEVVQAAESLLVGALQPAGGGE